MAKSQGGTAAPQFFAISTVRAKLPIGRMPGTISASIPAARARSTNLR
jgi:hypothetical protein